MKAAVDLELREQIYEVLSDEDRWILDIRRARTEELFAEPEREDGTEQGFTPPKIGLAYTAPQIVLATRKEG